MRLSLIYNSGHEPCVKHRVEKKSLLHGFVYINNKMGKLHQSVFLVFTGEQEQLNIVSAMNPIGNREDCRY